MSVEMTKKNNRVFLPITINRKLWNFDAAMIFLNQVYCEQLDEKEKSRLHYSFCNVKRPIKDKLFRDNIKAVAACIGQVISSHSKIYEDREYWERLFFRCLLYIVYDVQVKILQFEALKSQYRGQEFYTYTKKEFMDKNYFEGWPDSLWTDDYHLWLYTYLAKRYFGIQVEPVEIKGPSVARGEIEKKKNSFLHTLYYKIKKACTSSPQYILRKLREYMYIKIFRGKEEVLYYCLDIPADTSSKWLIGSVGKIQPLQLPLIEVNVPISDELRRDIIFALRNVNNISPIVADIIGRTLPKLYLEEYKYHHENSLYFLTTHKKLKVILSYTGILSCSKETIFSFLAQSRGVKILELQHGGNYELVEGILEQEEYLSDVFYSWSRGAAKPRSSICEILSSPSYKFSYYWNMKSSDRYVLFVGTAFWVYTHYDDSLDDVHKKRYIDRQIEFFSALEKHVRDNLYVKEFYVDYGWHIVSCLTKLFPMLQFLGTEKIATNFSEVDMIDRNTSFAEVLTGCRLMVCDHLSTTWREALYLNKPFIMLLDRQTSHFREEALENVRLMEEVGIIIYDCDEAAWLVNRIHENVQGWWNEPTRQRVVKKIREDYLSEVDDIDDWWIHELLRQARK